ncbi:SDR family oxidoreductase [Corynebacterium pseudotuberculosis]|uniref:SDR family NAD(P)-dependent oxidoreductase n=1 Tax=Corynebacterium pseudotuberculosis TaxID=1719 RepID=UPI00025936C8|nr:SDR family NAD(P)-dependent oxidoreductase [Corynebacterium pseudotuberculosis]AFH89939.1 SDR family NAD(P)-dependent oxidoreductase [Corynebacterium pseudotuberculosis 31]APB10050.1 SDR family oxidoreductase [Corynebacterium pseudotuberculosis]APB12097.1 SDR family oxidoreductase [Corynebacterium pseudotuberculosis]APB14144.1 SDR family oxidoreductase [Corynebacterium pseudotuberculosis]APB16195.1 SDR family oxidoreductase [Corynebacterium pseudotuberculosis]
MTKTAIVTGGSSGIGEATARALASDGWYVIVAARRMDRLRRIASEIGGEAIQLDVTSDESVAHFASCIQQCHLLVNNAGGALGLDPIAEASIADWQWMYETNVLGTLRVTRSLLDVLHDGAQIINISSIAGIAPYAGGAGYNAAKFGVTAINKVMRIEFVQRNLRVTEINPGRVKTDFSLIRFHGDQAKADAVYADKLNLTAKDIAESIRWVASVPEHMNIDRMVITPRDQIV